MVAVSCHSPSKPQRTADRQQAESAKPEQATAADQAAKDAARAPADPAVSRSRRTQAVSAEAKLRERVAGASPARSTEAAASPGAAPLTSTGLLRRGTRDASAVSELQQQLNLRGAALEVDGKFGPKTDAAVRAFQAAQGLRTDGIVGPNTRDAFRKTAARPTGAKSTTPAGATPQAGLLRQGAEGPAVEKLQTRLNNVINAGLKVDGDFGRRTKAAVERFQQRAGLSVNGVAGTNTMKALSAVEAGALKLKEAPKVDTNATTSSQATGPTSAKVTVDGNTFNVHNQVRSQFGRRSVPGRRIIALDANSVSGRKGEILRPLIIIPNNATPAERKAAQESVDQVAKWLKQNTPDGARRASTGLVRTTAQNGRGLNGFYHTEYFSVNDTQATRLIEQQPKAFARILGKTLGKVPGANFIVPHGNVNRRGIRDPGAVSADGKFSEIGFGRLVIEQGFKKL